MALYKLFFSAYLVVMSQLTFLNIKTIWSLRWENLSELHKHDQGALFKRRIFIYKPSPIFSGLSAFQTSPPVCHPALIHKWHLYAHEACSEESIVIPDASLLLLTLHLPGTAPRPTPPTVFHACVSVWLHCTGYTTGFPDPPYIASM